MPRDPVLKGPDPGEGAPEETPVAAGPDGAFDPDDGHLDEQLRPLTLDDVVGQDKVVERLRIVLEAAKLRGDPLSHLLLDGPPGIGKTTLATVLPRELGVDVQITSGPSLSAPKDLLPYLTNAGRGSVLFIDEIHRLPPTVEEFIYPAMEDFRIDITLGEGLNARTINMQLEPFTLIGATTRSGMLTAPLRDRFVNREHLDFYDVDDVMEIIQRNARKLRARSRTGRRWRLPVEVEVFPEKPTTCFVGHGTLLTPADTPRLPTRWPPRHWRCSKSTNWDSTVWTASTYRFWQPSSVVDPQECRRSLTA